MSALECAWRLAIVVLRLPWKGSSTLGLRTPPEADAMDIVASTAEAVLDLVFASLEDCLFDGYICP